MDPFRNFFRDWFGYSRRERRSTFILLIIILTITGIKYMIPSRNIPIWDIPLSIAVTGTDSTTQISEAKASGTKKEENRYFRQPQLIDLNICDSAALEALPGIGPVLSVRIIRYRNLIGGFVSVGQLREVYGLSEETYNLISDRVKADSLDVRKISINSADYGELIRHPYFKKNEVTAILKYRELKGKIADIGTMIDNNLISSETAGKIRGYLDFTE